MMISLGSGCRSGVLGRNITKPTSNRFDTSNPPAMILMKFSLVMIQRIIG
jgi:hypothetical protein